MRRVTKIFIIMSTLFLTSFVFYKLYLFDLYFNRSDLNHLSTFHSGQLLILYDNGVIDYINDQEYKEFTFTNNKFDSDKTTFYSQQFYFEKVDNNNNTISYTIGLKREDYKTGGRRYNYHRNHNYDDIAKETFFNYLWRGANYDIVVAGLTAPKSKSP